MNQVEKKKVGCISLRSETSWLKVRVMETVEAYPERHSPAMNVINPPRPQRELDNVDEVVNWVILLLFRTGYGLYRSIARYEDN